VITFLAINGLEENGGLEFQGSKFISGSETNDSLTSTQHLILHFQYMHFQHARISKKGWIWLCCNADIKVITLYLRTVTNAVLASQATVNCFTLFLDARRMKDEGFLVLVLLLPVLKYWTVC